jgi:hypothetical protein
MGFITKGYGCHKDFIPPEGSFFKEKGATRKFAYKLAVT